MAAAEQTKSVCDAYCGCNRMGRYVVHSHGTRGRDSWQERRGGYVCQPGRTAAPDRNSAFCRTDRTGTKSIT